MEDIFLPFKKGGMNDIDLGEPSSSQPEMSSQDRGESSSMEIDSTSTQVISTADPCRVHRTTWKLLHENQNSRCGHLEHHCKQT